jgi:hypothetical protein
MRQFIIGILCSAAFLGGCSSNSNETAGTNASGETAAAEEYFTVRAGPVANASASAISGTFQMLKVAQANGIPSAGRGGACLAFRASDLGFTEMAKIQCQTDAQCSNPAPDGTTGPDAGSYAPDPANPTHRESRYGYCGDGICWSKPIQPGADPAVCNRPITMTANVLNPVPKTPSDLRPYSIKRGAKVRVVACLNKAGIDPTKTGCASVSGTDLVHDMGPVGTVR